MSATRMVQFVIKVSKLCNLRCEYCYEFDSLGDPARMTREQLRTLYRHVAPYYRARDAAEGERTEIRFIWHGGEPLLIEPEFYWQTFADQAEIFGDDLDRRNLVQTNLTKLDDGRIELLRDGFDHVGVSLDVFGGLRVQLGGRDSQARVLANLDRVRAAGVEVGCITVLTRKNQHQVARIHQFYEAAGIDYRVLPLFDGAREGQHESYDLSTEAMASACATLLDLWLRGDAGVRITPLQDHIAIATRYLTPGAGKRMFDKQSWNPTMLVDTQGDCYSYGDPYGDPEWSLGNLFRSSLAQIVTGEAFGRSVAMAEQRMAFNCTRCEFFGACDGYPIAEDQTNCREQDPALPEGLRHCVFERQLIGHAVERLRELGVGVGQGHLPVLAG